MHFVLGAVWIFAVMVYWLFQHQNYFKNHNIPCVKSYPLIGSFLDVILGKFGVYDMSLDFYNKPELKGKPFYGIYLFHKPGLIVNDPEIIKKICATDFNKFRDRYVVSRNTHDALACNNLLMVKNPYWKSIRGKFSPFFSGVKLKTMHYLVEKISNDMVAYVHDRLDENETVELEMKELFTLHSTDCIASCAFGVEANSLKNPDGEFLKAGHKFSEMTLWRRMELASFFLFPELTKLFNSNFFSHEMSNLIYTTVKNIMTERETSGILRNDLIDGMIELKNSGGKIEDLDMSMDILLAQAAAFFTGGFETASSLQSFALYEIARNEDIQDKIRGEIREMLERTEGKVTYDILMSATEMPYLHQIISETMRLYPSLPWIDRECTDPDGYSLEPTSPFRIPHKMPVLVPIYAIYRDERYFPDPLKFDPERFSPENAKNIISGTYFPFGIGPHRCIGERLGLMITKTGIVKTLKDFRLETTPNTPKEIIAQKYCIVMQSEKGLFLKLIKDPLY